MLPLLDPRLFLGGALLAWSLAAPPGPINALMAHAAARRGFLAGWVYGLGAITGDMTMLALTAVGVPRVVDAFPWLKLLFALVGAGLMLYFAWSTWRAARRVAQRLGSDEEDVPVPWGREFAKAYVVVTTSPYNWGFWLTAGSSMLSRLGWALALGFFVGILAWTIVWTGLARAGARRVKRLAEVIAYAAAGVLAVFAVVLLSYAVVTARSLL
jgi:threonine/homoserine/homoserine lactone efflux protein